jgi:hypothetical protein
MTVTSDAESQRLRPKFVSIKESYQYLGVGRTSCYSKLLPRLRTITLGKRRLVLFSSLEALADELLVAE